MTVAELRAALEGLPDDRLVVIDRGVGSPLAGVAAYAYLAETTWYGELKLPEEAGPDHVLVAALLPVG